MENLCVLYFFDVVHCNFVLLEMATIERPLFQLYCSPWLKVLKCNTNIPKTKSILIQSIFFNVWLYFYYSYGITREHYQLWKKKLRLNGIVLGQFFEMLTQIEELKQYKLLQTKGPIFLPLGRGVDRMHTLISGKFWWYSRAVCAYFGLLSTLCNWGPTQLLLWLKQHSTKF